MRVLVDANLPGSSVSVFLRQGHQALHVRDVGMGDATDDRIASWVQKEGFMLVTRDLDFANIRAYPPAEFAGILVLRMPEDSTAQEVNALLTRFAETPAWMAGLSGRLAILEPGRLRFRPPFLG